MPALAMRFRNPAVAAWTPMSLPGLYSYHNVSVLSSLWEDSARTTQASLHGPVGCIDDLSGAGRHQLQTISAARGTLRGTPTTPNLAPNGGDFPSDLSGWTVVNDVTWVAGKARANFNVTVSSLKTPAVASTASMVRVTWDQTVVAGTRSRVRFRNFADSADLIAYSYYTGEGPFEVYVVPSGGGLHVSFDIESGNTIDIDNVKIEECGVGQVAAPYWIECDGVDDRYTTGVAITALQLPVYMACARRHTDASSLGVMNLYSDNSNRTYFIRQDSGNNNRGALANTARGSVIMVGSGGHWLKHIDVAVDHLCVNGTNSNSVNANTEYTNANSWVGGDTLGNPIFGLMGLTQAGVARGRLYGALLALADPGADRIEAKRWLAALAGVTI